MNDISWSAEVRYERNGATGESFKNHPRAIVAKGWKHEYISRSQVPQDFCMGKPATEDHTLLDPQSSRQLLKIVPLRAVADNGEAGQIALQKGGGCAKG